VQRHGKEKPRPSTEATAFTDCEITGPIGSPFRFRLPDAGFNKNKHTHVNPRGLVAASWRVRKLIANICPNVFKVEMQLQVAQ
jgi:hypothetical protein